MQITISDLQLAHYAEQSQAIARGSESLLLSKIEIGTEEVKSYLNRYDTAVIFGEEWTNAHFKQIVVNVIQYHLIQLGLPGIAYDEASERYEYAIRYLEKVQQGKLLPDWPLRPNDADTPMDEAGNIQWSSNSKRGNHY